jgi:hypothetical protein
MKKLILGLFLFYTTVMAGNIILNITDYIKNLLLLKYLKAFN